MLAMERAGALYRNSVLIPAIFMTFAGALHAQQPQPQPTTLTLEEAVALARRHNPAFLAIQNDAHVAEWGVKQAYGELLPGASANTSFQYQASGQPRFGFFTGSDLGVSETPAYYASNYSVGVNYSLTGAALVAPGRAKATRRATDANIQAADFSLVANVRRQYLAVVRAQDAVTLARQELERADENLKLATARVRVGVATPIEQKQAEVEKGRTQVTLLQSENLVKTERLRLMQQLGLDSSTEVQLTTTFAIGDVPWTQEALMEMALQGHPDLLAARANEVASAASVKMARSAYLPSLSFSAGLSGYAREAGSTTSMIQQAREGMVSAKEQCEFNNAIAAGKVPGFPKACPSGVLTPDMENAIISSNNVFPFNYSREPLSAQLTISLPIFQGFGRELQIQQAKAAQADARHWLRGEELRLKADIGTAYLNAKTARESVALEERNKELAQDQLNLARERYRVGVASFLELQDANTMKARADRAFLVAVYSFHESMAALEHAVGRPLNQ